MNFRCPLCESEIETEVDVVDGQHVNCPSCENKFTFYVNAPSPEPQQPLIIASGEDFERYLCDQINELACAKCEMTKSSGDQGVDLIVTLADGKTIAIQCKLYSTPVGNDAVQQVIAGRIYYKCDMAAVVTNNVYTDSAVDLANASDVRLLHYAEVIDWVSGLGGSKKSRLEAFKEEALSFFKQHPSYETEILLHLKYKLENPYAFSPDEIVNDLENLQEDVLANGRRLMRETARLVNVMISDLRTEMYSVVSRGYFGRSLSRCEETYEATRKAISLDTLDQDGWKGIGQYVGIVTRLMPQIPRLFRLKTDTSLNDQIFKDELPPGILSLVEGDYHVIADKEIYHKLVTGQYVDKEVTRMKEYLEKFFGRSWAHIVLEIKKRKDICPEIVAELGDVADCRSNITRCKVCGKDVARDSEKCWCCGTPISAWN